MPSISLREIITFLSGAHIKPADHIVLINGVAQGECTRASIRSVMSLHGLEIPVEYAYLLSGEETTLSSRLRTQGLGKGGREQIKVNGKDVQGDDVIIAFEASGVPPKATVEFRFALDGIQKTVTFVAPLDKLR